jgi:hypothetical protein
MKIPGRYRLPPEMEEAMLVVELNVKPWELDRLPQTLIEKILIYRGVKNVATYGGTWQP